MLSASIVASVLLLLLAAGAYARETRRGGRGSLPGMIGLLAFRLVGVLLFFLVSSGIVIRREWSRPGRVVAVLHDVSRSMAVTRADSTALRVLGAFAATSAVQFEVFAFAETAVAVRGDPLTAVPDAGLAGTRTLLGAALAAVARRQPGAVLLLSDGQDNGPGDPVRGAVRAGIPVYAVGCGPRQVANLVLTGLRVPVEAYVGETTRVSLLVDWRGPGPAAATVELNGRRQELQFDAAGIQEVDFRLVSPVPGFQQLRATADSVPGEVTAVDNVIEGTGHVRPGRIRVRYLTGAPGPSSRFMTRELRRLPRVRLAQEVVGAHGGPATPGDDRTDVYVLDQVQAGSDWPGWQRIAGEVSAGAGVLLLGGPGFAVGHPLARFVPGGAAIRRGPVKMAVQSGHPVAAPDQVLDRLPPLEPAAPPSWPDSFEPWFVDAEGGAVLVGSRRMGRGRVLYFAGPVWRWGFMPGDMAGAPTALERVLAAAAGFLSSGAGEPLRFIPVRSTFMAGDPVQLELGVRAPDGRPLTGAGPTVTVEGGDEGPIGTSLGPLPMVELGDGRYVLEVAGLGPGWYEATVTAVAGEAKTGFAVTSRSREEAMVGLDDKLLREIARGTGGRYFSSDSLPGPGFEMELAPSHHGFEFVPRRSVLTYLLLALLVATEWALRRRKGLL